MKSLKEAYYSEKKLQLNPLESSLQEAGLIDTNPNVKDAEIVGKASPIDKINGIIQIVIDSKEAKKLILTRIQTCIAEMFYENLAIGSGFLSDHDLREALKQMIYEAIPNIEGYLNEVDDELEYATDFYKYLNDKIAELSELHTPAIIQKFHNLAIQKNKR